MSKAFSVAFKQKMVQRLTGKNAVSALQLWPVTMILGLITIVSF